MAIGVSLLIYKKEWACLQSGEIIIVKSIIVVVPLHYLCLDITREGEPITLKASGSFFEKL